jgi:hypothetical protein
VHRSPNREFANSAGTAESPIELWDEAGREMTAAANKARKVGSFAYWVVARITEAFLLVIAFRFAITSAHISWHVRTFCILAICLVLAYFHNYAWGTADEQGLTFRRYLSKHQASWDDVARVDWVPLGPNLIVVTFEKSVGLTKRAKFTLSFKPGERGAPFTSHETPDIVIWIMNHLRPAA